MITKERSQEIQERAFNHVHSFVEARNTQAARLIALGPKFGVLGSSVRDFADSVVLKELKDEWGKNGFPSLRTAQYLPLFQVLSAKTRHELIGFPSWLYMVAHVAPNGSAVGCPMFAAVFDEDFILLETRRTRQNPEIARVRLFYHELGHFVLHRLKLFGDLFKPLTKRSRPADKSSQHQEEEAWLYAATVIGLALGDHAYSCRTKDLTDDTWLLA